VASRILKLRRVDVCAVCGCTLAAGTQAVWDSSQRTVTCAACNPKTLVGAPSVVDDPLAELERGHAGASAGREYQRRRGIREARTREAHPLLGGLLLALRDPPSRELAFRNGEIGEKSVARSLERRTAAGPSILLHDLRMPDGHGNIDHLAVAPAGVFVIDAKNYKGRVEILSPLFKAPKLLIAGRDRTSLIDGLERQLSAVRRVLADGHEHVPVLGVLCFWTADLPLVRTLSIRGHLLLYPKALARRLNADGRLSAEAIGETARALAAGFPPA
jgi:Nuclease-related domain